MSNCILLNMYSDVTGCKKIMDILAVMFLGAILCEILNFRKF